MARKRASMREGPLAELFRATEAAQRGQDSPPGGEDAGTAPPGDEQQTLVSEPETQPEMAQPPRREEVALEATVEHVYDFGAEETVELKASDSVVAESRAAAEQSAAPEIPAAVDADSAESVEPEEPTVIARPRLEAVPPLPEEQPQPEPPVVIARAHEPARPAEKPYNPPSSRFLAPMPESAPRLEVAGDVASYLAVIRVVGVGGAGLNAVNRMMDAGIAQVDFVAVNTDAQQLELSDAGEDPHRRRAHARARLGRRPGHGSQGRRGGVRPDPVRSARVRHGLRHRGRGRRHRYRRGPHRGPNRAGAGSPHGRDRHDPVQVRGHQTTHGRRLGRRALRAECDTLIVIPNDRLLEVLDRSTSMVDAFRIADDVLRQGVQGICDLITMPGLINLDFADVRTVMSDAGSALMGIGYSEADEGRAREAAERALRSPLIDSGIVGARGILLSVAGGEDLTLLMEVTEAAEVVRQAATDRRTSSSSRTSSTSGSTALLGHEEHLQIHRTGLGGTRRRAHTPTFSGVAASSAGRSGDSELPTFLR